jgi:hypothetical protein
MKVKINKPLLIGSLALFTLILFKAKKMFTELDAKKAILNIKDKYGLEMAMLIEQMFRFETNHFKSLQYKKTGTAGLTVGKWPAPVPKSPTVTFKTNPALDSAGRSQIDYIVWNPAEFTEFLVNYIKRYNGNFGRWFSTDPEKQKAYINKVSQVKTRFV